MIKVAVYRERLIARMRNILQEKDGRNERDEEIIHSYLMRPSSRQRRSRCSCWWKRLAIHRERGNIPRFVDCCAALIAPQALLVSALHECKCKCKCKMKKCTHAESLMIYGGIFRAWINSNSAEWDARKDFSHSVQCFGWLNRHTRGNRWQSQLKRAKNFRINHRPGNCFVDFAGSISGRRGSSNE